MSRKFILRAVLSLCLLLILTLPSKDFGQGRTQPRSGGVFRLKSFSTTLKTQLDPASPDSFIFISEQLYDGLVRLDSNYNPLPSLADYWERSSDGKRYTFYLRKGVLFHHGPELTAEDVKFSLERLLDKETNSPYYQFFLSRVVGAREFRTGKAKDVSGFKVIDKYTFEIRWTEPFISGLYLMSLHFCKILPRERVEDRGRRFFDRPSGTGPFSFHYWMRSPRGEIVGIRLKRNENYFGGKPYLEAVEFSPHFTLDHFLNGEIESIPVLSDRLLSPNFQVYQDGSLHPIFLGMSCHIPPFDKPVVRKAIAYAIDKREIARETYDLRYIRQLTNCYIPSRLPGFFPRDDKKSYDIGEAVSLLNEAGYTADKEFPDLTLFLDLPRTDLKNRIYRAIREQLEALGIRLRVSYHKSIEEVRNSTDPYLILFGRAMSFPDPEDVIRPFFFSRSPDNVIGYSNPELDRILQKAEIERSYTQRIKLFHQIEEILFSDVPALPLFSHQNRVVMQPYVRGVEVPPLGFSYLDAKKIWLDK